MKRCILTFTLLFAGHSAQADQPPSWTEFSVKSENMKAKASIAIYNRKVDLRPWEQTYRIKVEKKSGNGRSLKIWEAPYFYRGYAEGVLSDDGEYFAYVDFWYQHEHPAIEIYHHGAYCYFTGQQLGLDSTRLQKTISHQLWLNSGPKFIETSGMPTAIVIPTVQGEKRIDLNAKKISYRGNACQAS